MSLTKMESATKVESGVDAARFRGCMRSLTGAVSVITCGEIGERTGLTATAVCSVTDSPPMLLVCVNSNASAHSVIRDSGRFAVNVLAESDAPIAGRFAGQGGVMGEARFNGSDWTTLETGAPVLTDAVVSFDCLLETEHQYGSHSIFIGKVMAASMHGGKSPLLYHDGHFGTFAVPAASSVGA